MSESNEKYKALKQLPQFPAIATKVLRVLSRDETSVDALSALIRADPGLSSDLLRIVNSPLHGFTSHVSSIQKALVLLGFDEVKRFVLAVSMKGFFQSGLRLDLLRAAWRHSLACAIVCSDLSVACSESQSPDDRAYTTGLLHDIGRLALFVAHPQPYAELLGKGGAESDIRERERQAFGFDHCEGGGWLASNWGLPDEVQRVAAGHHEPVNKSPFELEDLVRVGVLLTDGMGFAVVPPEHPCTVQEARSLLPHTAQYRFDPDPDQLLVRVTERLDAFD